MGPLQPTPRKQVINHPILTNSTFQITKGILKTEVLMEDEGDLAQWITTLQKVKNLQSPFLFDPISYSIVCRSMCGNSCILSISYPFYPYLLIDQILNRKAINKQFEENQLWYILYAMAEASFNFSCLEGSIGDVRPHNILFNEKGEIKIIHRLSWPGQLSNFDKTSFNRQETFLAPQQMSILFSGKTYNSADLGLAESFSAGLTLLSVMCLQDLSTLYDIRYMQIDTKSLNENLSKIEELNYLDSATKKEQNYSTDIIKIVQRMCQIDEHHRLRLSEIFKWLFPYRSQILNFQKFQLKVAGVDNIVGKESQGKTNHHNSLFGSSLSKNTQNNIINPCSHQIIRPSGFKFSRPVATQRNIEKLPFTPPEIQVKQPLQNGKVRQFQSQQNRSKMMNQFPSEQNYIEEVQSDYLSTKSQKALPLNHKKINRQPLGQLNQINAGKIPSNEDLLRKIQKQVSISKQMFPS